MKLCFEWLSQFIELEGLSPEELADLLTMKTCEIEAVEEFLPELKNVLIGKVTSIKPHPDADKLVICEVDAGESKAIIVTGAPNVEENALYPVALPGVTIPNGLTLKLAKLRGVESQGMLCSAAELCLTELQSGYENIDGLWRLPDAAPIGESIANAYNFKATMLDVDNKSITHRPDLWSHFGFAREISGLINKPLKESPTKYKDKNSPYNGPQITIKQNAALGYCGAIISNVSITSSPWSLQFRLLATGMRPINNVVDASNLTMLEIGQPNHPFDFDLLQGNIEIDISDGSEILETLDGIERQVPPGIPLILANRTPVAFAGVMGGASSEVSEKTTSLFFESATFYRKHIRKAVTQLGLRTEASARFEKGQSTGLAAEAYELFLNYLRVTCPDLKGSNLNQLYSEKSSKTVIQLDPSFVRQRLGINIDDERIKEVLTNLNFLVSDNWNITVPDHRSTFDIGIPEDLVEEVGRFIGYASIPLSPSKVNCEVPQYKNEIRIIENALRKRFTLSYQFSEVHNYAFVQKDELNIDTRFAVETPKLKNPTQDGQGYMKNSLLPHLLRNVSSNFRQTDQLRFFEIDRIFKTTKDLLPEEKLMAGGIIFSKKDPGELLWSFSRSVLHNLLISNGVDENSLQFSPLQETFFHPGRQGKLVVDDLEIHYGLLHPQLLTGFKLQKYALFYFDFCVDRLNHIIKNKQSKYIPVLKFPHSSFEFTVVMNQKQPFSELSEIIGNPKRPDAEKTALYKVTHLNTYSGENIEAGKKAVSVKVTWINPARTLLSDEIKELQEKLLKKLEYKGFQLKS